MGTTRAFYHIMNRGFDKVHLQDGLNRLYEGKPASQLEEMEALLKSLMGEEKFQQFQQEEARLNSERGLDAGPELPSPMATYRRDAAWLPFLTGISVRASMPQASLSGACPRHSGPRFLRFRFSTAMF